MSGNVRIVQLPWHWHSMAAACNSLQLINERIVGRNGLLNHARGYGHVCNTDLQ